MAAGAQRSAVRGLPALAAAAAAGLFAIACGCTSEPGDGTGTDRIEQRGDLRLSSPAFPDGGAIPDRYAFRHGNASPPLAIASAPAGTRALVLICCDPDAMAPAGKIWDHWVLWNIDPATAEIPEGTAPAGALAGRNDFGNARYDGPAPPDRRHTYRFRLYALDAPLELPAGASRAEVEAAMAGHILAQTELDGTYAP